MSKLPQCSSCGQEISVIRAAHEYSIEYDPAQDKWVKKTCDVDYSCGLCLETLSKEDIADILRQVDEL